MTAMFDRLRRHRFVLAGFGCEYSLQPLASYLEQEGFAVVTADMQNGPMPQPSPASTVFVTSQHTARSSFVFHQYYGRSLPFSNHIGPLELMRHLQPACSVFIPHDLEVPVLIEELACMGAFDIYCSPFPQANPSLHHACRVVPCGWIKHNHLDELPLAVKDMASTKGVFFLNQISAVAKNGGAAAVAANFPRIFDEEIPIKLPVWPDSIALGGELRRRGGKILMEGLSSTKLIAASPQIYVNAPGSVVAEARYLGVPALQLKPGNNQPRTLVTGGSPQSAGLFDFPLLMQSIAEHIEAN